MTIRLFTAFMHRRLVKRLKTESDRLDEMRENSKRILDAQERRVFVLRSKVLGSRANRGKASIEIAHGVELSEKRRGVLA